MARIDKTNLERFTSNIKTYIANLFKSPNFGTGNTNSGENSIVSGTSNKNSGSNVIQAGKNHTNTANEVLQVGAKNENSGRYAFQWGYGNVNTNPQAGVGGLYSEDKKDALFVIGNGSSSTRSNAFEVYKDGRAKAYGAPTEENDVVRKKELDNMQSKLTSTTVLGKINGKNFTYGGSINIEGESGNGITEERVNELINTAISGSLGGSY